MRQNGDGLIPPRTGAAAVNVLANKSVNICRAIGKEANPLSRYPHKQKGVSSKVQSKENQ